MLCHLAAGRPAPIPGLPLAREVGLPFVEITTNPDNVASQRVIAANGGVLVETFTKDPRAGVGTALRYRVALE